MLDALSAVGACVQIVKTLWEYYNVHNRNKALLDILEGFTQNLEISIDRLQAREQMLGLGQNDALDSIEKDFTNAKTWLLTNDKNLRSKWTALQAADKLKDLDDRLTKAFASKMSVAIFTALQDTRHGITKLQTTVDGLPSNLAVVCRAATKESIQAAIVELKKEAYEAVGAGEGREKGFHNGEAEKIISQLVDQLAEQERLKEEEELFAAYTPIPPSRSLSMPTVPYASTSSTSLRRYASVPSSQIVEDPFEPISDAFEPDLDPFEPTTSASDRSSVLSRGRSIAMSLTSYGTEVSDGERSSKSRKEAKEPLPSGAVVLDLRDPLTDEELFDPVLASDGLIYSRWSLVHGKVTTPVTILGDVVQLREALFASIPDRKIEFEKRRRAFREETIRLYEISSHDALPSIIDRLSHILLYDPSSVSIRIRLGTAFYRSRLLSDALRDLSKAVELSTTSVEGVMDQHEPDVDALRIRALVLEELHDNEAATRDVDAVLAQEPHDVLTLSLRAILLGNSGDIDGAEKVLKATNVAVRSGGTYRSRLGDSDCDLEFLARGWAYCAVRDFASAPADFSFSSSLRDPPEPYTLACRGLSKIRAEESSGSVSSATLNDGLHDLDTAIDQLRGMAIKEGDARYTSGAARVVIGEDGLPPAAWLCLLLRGVARQIQGEHELALLDVSGALRLKPSEVKDVASVQCLLGELHFECGDNDGAERAFDMALAVAEQPEQRDAVLTARERCGL